MLASFQSGVGTDAIYCQTGKITEDVYLLDTLAKLVEALP